MTSKSVSATQDSGGSRSPICALPPVIILNPRDKVLAEEIDLTEIEIPCKVTSKDIKAAEPSAPIPSPVPLQPLAITWSPDQLNFEIKDDPIVQPLWVWNCSMRSIYIHCCDIWDEKAYLGAKWGCYPQTRFLLAPGIKAEMFVRASPKDIAPVPCAYPKLQLAAAHMRDHVIGYFAVPITAKFLNHIPYVGEGGG